jgi:hypothetical protein
MVQRDLIFVAGLLLLMILCGYVRDLGRRAGVPPQAVALLERLAILG